VSALLKIRGLDTEQLTHRAVAPSSMSLIGVIRHLTEVEGYWLRVVLLDEQHVPDYYCTAVSRDGDFGDIDPATAATDLAAFQAEIVTTRAHAAAWTDPAYPSAGCARASRSTCVESSTTSSRSTPATSAMDLLREARSTAVLATDRNRPPPCCTGLHSAIRSNIGFRRTRSAADEDARHLKSST